MRDFKMSKAFHPRKKGPSLPINSNFDLKGVLSKYLTEKEELGKLTPIVLIKITVVVGGR